ncbi:MAG TPA: DnaA/Hda family protein [Stellaceae bacterium]|nr:DnaA/Hda family protein [Stellaceae bacterium]
MAQLPLSLPHRPALGRDDFLVAPANAEAVAWLDRWPNWPAPALVLAGPAGSGKTHLAQVFAARSGAVLLAAAALARAAPPALVADARAAVVDDAERADEEALLHLYNMLAERGLHLLLLARAAPARWGIVLPDLRSRFLAAPVATLAPPDDALLAAVLVKLFADRQLLVGEEVVAFLVPRLERSFAAAASAVAALDQAALAAHRRITVPLARAVLGDG